MIASTIDWDDTTTWPKEKLDVVIGSDLIYQASIVPLLKKVVHWPLKTREWTISIRGSRYWTRRFAALY